MQQSPEIPIEGRPELTDDGFSEKKLARARERFGGKVVSKVLRKLRKAKKKEEVSRRERI